MHELEPKTSKDFLELSVWEAGFYALGELNETSHLDNELLDSKIALEMEFSISFDDINTVTNLRENSLRDFKEKLNNQITAYLYTYKDDLFQKVCIEFNYCEQRNKPMARLIEGLLLALDFLLTGGAAALILFALKSGFFDNLCGCDVSAQKT